MKKIKLSDSLSLPIDAVTQSTSILAKRRVGKSYCARKLAEQTFEANQQICIVDPKGDWWGIRYARDGKRPGLPIIILGGERGDAPLEVNSGAIVAKLLVEERVSVLLDLSLFRKREVAIFMTAFMEDLYRLKNLDKYRSALMLLIDEADAIAPQKPQPEEARMLGAIEDIVRRGGQRGLGTVLITQRSAVLNKNVLTQTQIMICLRTIAPQDLKAMNEWIDVHGSIEEKKILMESLPSLPIGDAWVWSPGWPTNEGIFKRVHIDQIDTFDSGATPKPGEKQIKPKNIAQVDLEAIKRQMAETLEKAKADDPKELKKKIAELEKQIKAVKPVKEVKAEVKQIKIITDAQLNQISDACAKALALIDKTIQGWRDKIGRVQETIKEAKEINRKLAMTEVGQYGVRENKVSIPPTVRFDKPSLIQKTITNQNPDSKLGRAERSILTVLAQFERASKSKVAALSGYASSGGGFNNALGKLRTLGYINTGEPISATESGIAALGDFEPLPTGQDLHQYWYGKLQKAEALILKDLIKTYPAANSKERVAFNTGYNADGGGFNNALGRLRTLELITGSKNDLRASENLF